MTVKAPVVTSLEISKLSANHVSIRWDEVGENFYYLVELSQVNDAAPEQTWQALGYTPDNTWFISTLSALTKYKLRVAVAAEGFEQSDWVETEEFETFEQNAYTFESMTELSLVNKFIDEKFTKNNENYVDFSRDVVFAALMDENFQFSKAYEHISSISNYIIKENQYHEFQGYIEKVCIDKDRTYLMESDGVLYLFERYQPIVKVSNDKGQTWHGIKLLNDRVGYPLSRTVFSQSDSTTYLLGYDRIFNGRKSTDTRWSSDEARMSSQDLTFAKIGDTLNLGFDVEIFGTYARLPGEIATIAESITTTEEMVYVVARDVVRFVKAKNAPIDTDPLSPTFGEKKFESTVSRITGNSKAVCYKLESVGEKVYALITGEVSVEKANPRIASNVVDSQSKGVYLLNTNDYTWKRVFGNTAEERRRIEHGYSSISTNGKDIFFSTSNFKFGETQIIEDIELADSDDNVSVAVKYAPDGSFIHDKHYMMEEYRSNEALGWETFKSSRMGYYAEPFFSNCKKSNTRCWIDNNDQVVVVYSDIVHEKAIDPASIASPDRVMKEIWNNGTCTVISPNIEFKGFTQYASGIMLYRYSGELIGYYEFNYRVKDEIKIVWKPSNTMFNAFLQHQEHEEVWTPTPSSKLPNPDLRPLMTKMIPDSYLLEDSNFEKFCEYYIQYISNGYGTHYNNLVDLVRNKYPREEHSWEYLWSEIYKRNIYLNKDKRDEVSRFFETRKNDFYSTKGIEASYKFLFKVLYNEEVEIDIESNSGIEYDIIVESNNVSEDLVGRTIYTATGRSNVTYIERNYTQGKLQWRITIHNLIGRFIAGQEIKSEKTSFEGMIVQGVRSKDLLSNNIDYINRSRSYYVMKIKSSLATSRYRDDVLRFVHPVGFGFIGITLLTMFINAGLSMKHVETIINRLKSYKWDSGLPSVWPDRVAVLDGYGDITYDPITGEPLYNKHPRANEPFELRPNYDADNKNSIKWGLKPSQRRRPMSPLFDQSSVVFSQFRNLVDERLKDNINNPRDPQSPTQVKVDELQ